MKRLLVYCFLAFAAPAIAQPPAVFIKESKRLVADSMKDPGSTKFRNVKMSDSITVCGEVNSKNSYGGYVGFKRFFVIGAAVSRVEDSGPLPEAFESTYATACLPKAKAPKLESQAELEQIP